MKPRTGHKLWERPRLPTFAQGHSCPEDAVFHDRGALCLGVGGVGAAFNGSSRHTFLRPALGWDLE